MKCENCGSEHDGSFGSGRFCSRACANTRHHSDETKMKISESLKVSDKINHPEKNDITKKSDLNKQYITKGKELAQQINLSQSPYSEYNVATIRKQVDDRESYKLCLYDDDNHCVKSEVVLVYRYNMACKIGRRLSDNEVVHHKDHNPNNNNIDNLELMTNSEHASWHATNDNYGDNIKSFGGWNKGQKMSEDFKEHCRKAALLRWSTNKT